jgi:hypothetical protein
MPPLIDRWADWASLGKNPPKDANDALRHPSLDGEELILQMLQQVTSWLTIHRLSLSW